jgi:pimeloyl-ACP methyl ester carboxylesterase
MHKLFFLLILIGTAASAQHKTPKVYCPEVFEMHKANGEQDLHYASSQRLNRLDTAISTVLIYIHGLHRNGMNYFGYAEDAVRSAKEKKTTLIIAPQYMNEEDIAEGSNLFWEKATWKDGYESISSRNRNQKVAMSSYEALDSLITSVISSGKFPNITRIVIVGHSAGGQFVQRYSITTPLPDLLSNYVFRFIVMNPSSYLYPDAQRPITDSTYGIPDTSVCPQYNHYPKGLTALNSYAQAAGADRILHNMLNRDIVILLGNNDTQMDDPDLDVSCAANIEGRFRLERGIFFIAHIKSFPGYGHHMNFSIVPGMAHEGDMINTPEALYWIYRENRQK